MGPNCGNFLGIFGLAVTAQKISGLFGCFYFTKIALNHVFVWTKAGNGLWIGPKTWDRNYRNFWRLYGLSVTVQNFSGCGFVFTYALNGCLVCIGPGMAVDCGFTK